MPGFFLRQWQYQFALVFGGRQPMRPRCARDAGADQHPHVQFSIDASRLAA